MSDFFSSTCGETFHYFLRDNDEIIAVFHSDDSECKTSEFSFSGMLNDELDRVVSCAWCDKRPADSDHIRKCSGFIKPYTRDEIEDCYSDPSERAKRDGMLRSME
jgi:hypothetical protein